MMPNFQIISFPHQSNQYVPEVVGSMLYIKIKSIPSTLFVLLIENLTCFIYMFFVNLFVVYFLVDEVINITYISKFKRVLQVKIIVFFFVSSIFFSELESYIMQILIFFRPPLSTQTVMFIGLQNRYFQFLTIFLIKLKIRKDISISIFRAHYIR